MMSPPRTPLTRRIPSRSRGFRLGRSRLGFRPTDRRREGGGGSGHGLPGTSTDGDGDRVRGVVPSEPPACDGSADDDDEGEQAETPYPTGHGFAVSEVRFQPVAADATHVSKVRGREGEGTHLSFLSAGLTVSALTIIEKRLQNWSPSPLAFCCPTLGILGPLRNGTGSSLSPRMMGTELSCDMRLLVFSLSLSPRMNAARMGLTKAGSIGVDISMEGVGHGFMWNPGEP